MKPKHELVGKLYELTLEDKEFVDSLKTLDGNRKIKQSKVKDIVNAILERKYIGTILVDEATLQVVEGNHRIEAAKYCIQHNIPFKLRIEFDDFELPLDTARLINNTGSKWSLNEKFYSFCVEGREAYLRLRELMDRHSNICTLQRKNSPEYIGNYQISSVLICAGVGIKKSDIVIRKEFIEGNFTLSDFQILTMEKVLNELEAIQGLFPDKKRFNVMRLEAIKAWCGIRGSISDFSKFIETFRKSKDSIVEPAQRIGDWAEFFINMNQKTYEHNTTITVEL